MSEEEANESKRIRNFPSHNINPYIGSKQYITENRRVSISVVGDTDRDECHITNHYKIDSTSFLKILCDNLHEKLRISRSGIIIFCYLYEKLKKELDNLLMSLPDDVEPSEEDINNCISQLWVIDEDHVRASTGYSSHQSLVTGISELLYVNVISRSVNSDVYFINPAFFKPIRTLMVTEYYTNNCGSFKKTEKDVGIRDFPRAENPYIDDAYNNGDFVNIFLSDKGDKRTMSISNCYKVDKVSLVEMLCDNLLYKFGVGKSGVEIFRFLYNKVRAEIKQIKDLDEMEERFFAPWILDLDECLENTKYTTNISLFNGVAELLEKNIIARCGNNGMYFINPNFFKPSAALVLTDFYKIKTGKPIQV